MRELTDKELDAEVLRVLAGQSPGYLIHPTAAAFVSDGLDDPDAVEASLNRLTDAGHAEALEEVALRYKTRHVHGPDDVTAENPKMVPRHNPDGSPLLDLVLGEDGHPQTEPLTDGEGREVVLDAGWQITDGGRQASSRS